MAGQPDNIFTTILTDDSITLLAEWGVRSIAMRLTSGAGSFQGSATLGTIASSAIPLEENEPVTISDDNYIAGLKIDCSGGGVIEIIARR